jgi:hypothetical protein
MMLFSVSLIYRTEVCPPAVLAEMASVHQGPAFPVLARTAEEAALNAARMFATPLRSGTGIRPGDLIEVRIPGQPARTFEVGLFGLVPASPVTDPREGEKP